MSKVKTLDKNFVNSYKDKTPNWGFNGLGYIVYKRTYSRVKENGENEEWFETVERCVNGAQKIGAKYTKEEMERLYDLVFNLKCNFAGRMLWQLGTSTVDRFGANSLLNCWNTAIKKPEDFCFVFENLMLGGGVGFSVRREDVHELPKVKKNVKISHECTKDADFIVADSRSGWIALLRNVLQSYFETGKSFSYSTILVRGAGEPIAGFGGTASGPLILVQGIEKICNVLKAREGKKMRSVDALDICNIIGSVVVAGNVRRSAEIALGDPDDILFLRAKRWDLGNVPNWRAMSNNTIYADDFDHVMEEVWDGYKGNGEPYGFFNLPLSQKYGRLKDGKLGKDHKFFQKEDDCIGTNPCFTIDTEILTKDGYKIIGSLLGKEVEIIQDNRAFGYIKDGSEHWVVDGRLSGFSSNMASNIRKTASNQEILEIKTVGGKSVKATANHHFATYRGMAELKDIRAGELVFVVDFINGQYVQRLDTVETVNFHSVQDVYCLKEDNRRTLIANGFVARRCGEISLSDKECCNLAELYLNNIESQEELNDCAKLLYKTQKAIAALPFIHDETNKIVHKNMRLGLGATGICQSLDKLDWLDKCYEYLREFDKEWSEANKWPVSIKLTTCKPSGSLSLLAGSTPGVHPGFSKYYIRRVRMSSGDKLVQYCRDLGFHVEFALNFDKTVDHGTVVVEFPCTSGDNAILTADMSAIKQLEIVKKLQEIWADNAVSVTVYYKLDELDGIQKWMKENYSGFLKSVSFLLHSDHGFQQAPYQEINKEEYERLKSKVKPIYAMNFDSSGKVFEGVECSNGSCPIR
jgi:ribonucleotide reductase alpha subunit